ncbi:4-amino-4-deoxychorismate lyase OS=Ureibacillus acetophenoni OX=614649 GN=SAMN05877842_1248 PE=4 SV=1 [Ureibacillus acetophenoni]
MILWMNGKYIDEKEITISSFDHGFLYGINFFEKFRTYKGQVVLFQEHYNRLITKLNQFRIKMPYSVKEILQVIQQLRSYANDQEGIYFINVSTRNENSNFRQSIINRM